jgi:hypothetical protein
MNNLGLVNIDIENLKSDMQILRNKYNSLLTTNNVNQDNSIDNNIDMSEICSQSNQKPSFSSLFKVNNKTVSPPMADIINTVNDYNEQKKKRENNLIIFGLKNVTQENVNQQVKSLFTKLHVENIKFNNPVLLVKKGVIAQSAPVKISLENETTKFKLLKVAKQLSQINQTDKSSIFINQDLSEIDRLQNKKLLEEKKKLNEELKQKNITNCYYGIRRNKVVKIDK